eukprot:gene2279-11018_t
MCSAAPTGFSLSECVAFPCAAPPHPPAPPAPKYKCNPGSSPTWQQSCEVYPDGMDLALCLAACT